MTSPDIPHRDDAPAWFRRALTVPFNDEHTVVDGCDIHYLAWGEPQRRGLVFVHGGGANAHWWTHLVASFAEDFRVLAIDLSGHGDSGHRDGYSLEQWTDEVVAVAAAGGIEGAPVVVGHSMGVGSSATSAPSGARRTMRPPSYMAHQFWPSPSPAAPSGRPP